VSQIPRLQDLRAARPRCDQGQTMPEYTVVLGVITLAIVIGIATLSGVIAETITNVADFF
jgi:Flp pilus assembly pilin Flp